MKSAALLVATILALSGATAARADTRDFLTKAMQGDNSETRLGEFAAKQGRGRDVRAFGMMLARDHRQAKREALAVARRHGVAGTDEMADEARAEYAKLGRLRGAAFDREFARYMVEDHRKDIADFQTEAASRDPADVRRLARTTIPTLRQHLATAQHL